MAVTKNLVSFGNLRNQTLYASRDEAIAGIKAEGTNDGVIKLGRYTDGEQVKTIFGISYTNGATTTYTIYDSFKEVIDDLQDQINAITGGSESITILIQRAIDELKGDVDPEYDTLEEIEAIIKQNKQDGVVTLESAPGDSGSTVATSYTIKQGGVVVGTFDIFKDSFIKTVQMIDKDGNVIDEEHPGIAYAMQFIFVTEDGSEKIVNIPVASFIQDLEAGDGLTVDASGKLNVVKDVNSEDFLEIYEDSIAIVGVQDAIDAAIATLNSELSAAIAAEKARAEAAEAELDEKITNEAGRATAAEAALNVKIEDEEARAKAEEENLLEELNKIEIVGTYGVSAKTNAGRVTTLRVVVGDESPLIDQSPLSVLSSGIRFATELDCGYYDSTKPLTANSQSDLTYLASGNRNMKMGSSITGRIGYGIMHSSTSSLDLNGKNLNMTGATSSTPTILLRGTSTLTLDDTTSKKLGSVTNESSEAPVLWTANKDCKLIVNSGNYISTGGHSEVVYCEIGTIELNGGTYRTTLVDGQYANKFVLNCKDANYKNGTANIIVKGGKFYNFNPADCEAEGEHTNFVAEGYHSVQLENETIEGVEYTVFEVVPNE